MSSGLLSLIVLLLLALFVIIVLFRTVKIVPQQTALIIERLGRYSRTLERRASTCWCRSSTSCAPTSTCASRWCPSRPSR